MAFRYRRYTTYGIRARVTILRPIWAQNENLKESRFKTKTNLLFSMNDGDERGNESAKQADRDGKR